MSSDQQIPAANERAPIDTAVTDTELTDTELTDPAPIDTTRIDTGLIDTAEAKEIARSLRAALAPHAAITHSQALETVARLLGHPDWNTAVPRLRARASGPAIPLLRIFDEDLARRFYLEFLGFGIEFEHRFAPGMPLYLRVRRSGTVLDLSGHHGDGTPGTGVWIPIADVRSYRDELRGRAWHPVFPDVDDTAPGGPTLAVQDPFGNVLRFCQPTAE